MRSRESCVCDRRKLLRTFPSTRLITETFCLEVSRRRLTSRLQLAQKAAAGFSTRSKNRAHITELPAPPPTHCCGPSLDRLLCLLSSHVWTPAAPTRACPSDHCLSADQSLTVSGRVSHSTDVPELKHILTLTVPCACRTRTEHLSVLFTSWDTLLSFHLEILCVCLGFVFLIVSP